jgi:hypothetical protein
MPGNNREKERTMKRIIVSVILVFGATVGLATRASAQEDVVCAKVPFSFEVGGQVLPSGVYRIEPRGDFLLFENKEGNTGVFANAYHGETSTNGKDTLTFDVVDGQYFLRKIVSETADTSADFPRSKLEKKAQELRASHQTIAATMGR